MKPVSWALVWVGMSFVIGGAGALAAPEIPPSDQVVLLRVPEKIPPRKAQGAEQLRVLLQREPKNIAVAVELATFYVAVARKTDDPRYFGMAETVIAPWQKDAEVPVDILLLRSAIRQHRHDFDAALADLQSYLERKPERSDVHMSMSVLLGVMGRHDAAGKSCQEIGNLGAKALADLCTINHLAATGRLESAETKLAALIPGLNGALRAWALELGAETAARLGKDKVAESRFLEALVMDGGKSFTVTSYVDFLLERGRARDALARIDLETASLGLLVRGAWAAKASGHEDRAKLEKKVAGLIEAEKMRGSFAHWREEALFHLKVTGDMDAARKAAQENWQSQREWLDARLRLSTLTDDERSEYLTSLNKAGVETKLLEEKTL